MTVIEEAPAGTTTTSTWPGKQEINTSDSTWFVQLRPIRGYRQTWILFGSLMHGSLSEIGTVLQLSLGWDMIVNYLTYTYCRPHLFEAPLIRLW